MICTVCRGLCCESDIDNDRSTHDSPTFHICTFCVDGTMPESIAWLRAEVEWLRSPVLHTEPCANCGHTKFRHREYRDSRTDNDMTKCWGRGFDCDDCHERCERFVRFTHDGGKP